MKILSATEEQDMRLVRGPSALGEDPRRFAQLAWTLATTEFKLRFFGSVLGYFWQLMRPLMLFAVMYVVFVVILNVGAGEPLFGIALLLGIVVFQFFGDATSLSIKSLIEAENLIRKIDFPRAVVPISCVLQAMFNLGLNLIPVFLFLLVAGGSVRATWVELPLIVGVLVVFVTGVALLLSALFVRFRDIDPIWDVVEQALFYGTPIIYSLTVVIDKLGLGVARLMLVSPLASAIQQLRHSVVDPSYVSINQVFSSSVGFLIPLGFSILTLLVGAWYFNKTAPHIAEEL